MFKQTDPVPWNHYLLTPILLLGILAQIILNLSAWNQISVTHEVLGRYSFRYIPVLVLAVLSAVIWIVLYLKRDNLHQWLLRLNLNWKWAIPAVIVTVILLTAVFISPLPIELSLIINTDWFFFILIVLTVIPEGTISRWWKRGLVIYVLLILPPLLVSSMANRYVHPDESQWADRATGIFHGGIVGTNLWIGFEESAQSIPGWAGIPSCTAGCWKMYRFHSKRGVSGCL